MELQCKSNMADEANKILILFVLLFLVKYSFSTNLISKCSLTVGSKTFKITSRTWQYKSGGYTYSINLCEGVKLHAPCVKSRVCKDSGSAFHDLGGKDSSKITSTLAQDGSGFSIEYTDGTCDKISSGKLTTLIQMKCGNTMGSPKLIDEFSNTEKGCIIVFEFITNEACKTSPAAAEVPCSFYNGTTNKKFDLSPLIKVTGGYEVMSTNFSDDFFINVCRDITPEKQGGSTHGCPKGSSSCRKQTSANHAAVTIGKVMAGSLPRLDLSTGHLVMEYNTTSVVPGCKDNPSTRITFVCPKDLSQASGKGPIMTSVDNCVYEVFWETEYACPQDQLLSNNSCILSNKFVQFDLTPLQRPPGHNYKVNGTDIKDSKKYVYYINVCRSTNIPDCAPSGYNASVCQEVPNTNTVVSLGVFYQQTLTYTDSLLTLKYKGGKVCSDGFPRETIINFKCNPKVKQGNPVFGGEMSHCVYFFDWETKYACPPSRRTGSSCRVTSNKGIRFDLSELVRVDQSNWLAIDGETSSSDRKIYLNVCGKLSQQAETSKCDNEAAICLVNKDGSVKSLGRYLNPPTLNSDKSVQLIYTNGDECIKGVHRTTKITFVCHPGDLTSPPVLVSHSQDDCEYTLMWETAAACSLGINVGDKCKVEDKDAGYVFDLSFIPTGTYFGSLFASVKKGKYNYYLQVCERLNDTSQKPCFRNVGGCQVDQTAKPKPKIVSIGAPNSKLYYYDGIIKLTYSNGDKCHNNKARETHISFICNPKALHKGDGLPEFDREEHCVYHFRWPTKYACPSKVVECAARSGSGQYDLSTLSKTDDNWQTRDSSTGKFYINVCRSLNLKPEVSGCHGTSAVCLVDNSGNFISLGGVDKSLNVTSQGTLTITYTKGARCDTDNSRLFETQIMFICKKGATDTSPVYQSKDKCTYKFRWETASACVITNVVGSNCSVQDPKSDTKFNMFPLNRRAYSPYVIKTLAGRTFQLNICGSIKGSCGSNKESEIGVCMNETNGKMINLGVASQQLEFMGETLVLTYRNGDRDIANGFPRITKIRFYCNPEEPLGQPKYIEQASEKDGEVFYFDFQTSLACSAKQVQCAVMGPNNKSYDLTPLGLVNGNWEAVDTRASYSHLHYYINICKSINPLASSDIKCPGGAIGACQVDHKTSKGHNLGYIQSNPIVTAEGEVTIRYYGGDACHGKYNRSIRINLSCSKTMGSPVFRGETPECEYIFHWETPSACPLTSEYGTNCGVIDRQYNYPFNFSSLSGKDYSVSGLPGGRTLMFDVCEGITGTSCKGSNVAACLKTPGAKEGKILGTVSTGITYLYGELFILYHTSTCSLKVTFECDQTGANKLPIYESFKPPCNYSIRFPTILACRPFAHVQCSLRRESSDKKSDLQYDFTPLAKRNGNWKADMPSSSAATYWINVCQPVHQVGEAKSCPPTAGICKYDPAKKSYISLGLLRSGPVVENNNIYLWYKGGDNCKTSADKTIQSSAKILMQCGSSTESSPQLVNEYTKTCLYEFVWVTKYACPINTGSVNITNDCTALHPQSKYKFDLNLLSDLHGKEVKDDRGYYYLLNVCKGLNDDRATPCGTNSGSCQLSKGSKDLHHNAGNYNKRLSYDDGVLSLNYSGGEVCSHSKTQRQTLISFVCDSKAVADGLGKPVFVAETDDCSYYFTWHTRLACERKIECSPVEYGGNQNIKYNLHDLANDQQNWLVMPLDGKYKGYTFYINICRSLVPVSGVNCPPGASACMRSKDGKKVQSLGRAVSRPTVKKNGKIVINYQNGSDQAQTTIELTCNPGSLGKPVFVSGDSNNFVLSWATLAACPQTETPQPDKCRVYDNNTEYFYDVSPLKKVKNGFISLAAPDGSTVYASVCGTLPINECDGDGVCRKHDKKTTSLGKFQYISMAYLNDEQMLLLKYCSKTCTQPGAVVSTIMFVCDENAVGYGRYSLDSVGDGGANIIWRTNLVCPPARQQCVLSDGGLLFDLALLSSKTRSWHYTSSKGFKFWLNICRGVEDQAGCPPYATVCAQFDSSVVVLGYGRTQRITRSNDGKELLVRYTGQSNIPACTRKGISAEVTFQLSCGRHVGTPKLIYSSFTACSFRFSWETRAACQTEQKKLKMSNCKTTHPETGRLIDFRKIDKSPNKVQGDKQLYYFSLCGSKLGSSVPSACSTNSLCKGSQGYEVKSKELRYQDFAFELWITTTSECPAKKNVYETFIINFQCSDKAGKPMFEYASSSCHYVFSWSTPIVCTKDQSGNVDDRSTGSLSGSSAGKKAGIAVAVIFTLLAVAAIIFVLHNRRRRSALVVFVRSNVRRIRQKGDSSSNAVYKYHKITVEDEEENDLLLGFSDEEDDNDHDYKETTDDDEMITL